MVSLQSSVILNGVLYGKKQVIPFLYVVKDSLIVQLLSGIILDLFLYVISYIGMFSGICVIGQVKSCAPYRFIYELSISVVVCVFPASTVVIQISRINSRVFDSWQGRFKP